MVSIAREAVTQHLRDNRGSPSHGGFVVFYDDCGGPSSRHKSVPVPVERTAGSGGIVLPGRECRYSVKRTDCERIDFLGTSADHHVLQPVLDQKRTETYGVGAACAGPGNSEVDALELEDAAEVHCHSAVHRLEDGPGAAEGRVLLLTHYIHGVDHRNRRAVIAIEEADLVRIEIVLVNAGSLQGIPGGTICIFGLLRHEHPLRAAELFPDVGLRHISRKG